MRSSGLLFHLNDDQSASIGYEDYGVEIFDGSDYEVTYHLDPQNLLLLLESLNCSLDSNIKKRLIEVFTAQFDTKKIEEHCKNHNIAFSKNIWIS